MYETKKKTENSNNNLIVVASCSIYLERQYGNIVVNFNIRSKYNGMIS